MEYQLIRWIKFAQKIAVPMENGHLLSDTFSITLETLWRGDLRGACHNSSAWMYILLSEQGFTPRLCIGEVRGDAGYFDHSWIELNDGIFDAAVCLPNVCGEEVSPPIFSSINLSTGGKTDLTFGTYFKGLDEAGFCVAQSTLDSYSELTKNSQDDLWGSTRYLGSLIGLDLSVKELRNKYGTVKREIRDISTRR
ncbi:hypothetical protein [Duganella sp. BJB488]|uniref:hypothetical protein n=1 Tax=Duganella sp. BJB488 TaxID=1871350 RepID=UPI0013149020|nr:hypothetical protein [Duganella sp. BJB488]